MQNSLFDAVIEDLLSEETFRDYLTRHRHEDISLEYKSGRSLTPEGKVPPKDGKMNPAAICKYVAGFANGVGGVLVLGVDESAGFQIDGCVPPGGKPVAAWVERAYSRLSPFLHPLPRTRAVTTTEGEVVVIAVPRSDHLVPCIEAGEHIYYLRIGDSTCKAPTYLVEDLYLGRRNRAHFVVSVDIELTSSDVREHADTPTIWRRAGFRIRFSVENTSLHWARDAVMGVIFFSGERLSARDAEIPERALADIQFGNRPPHHTLRHQPLSLGKITPFNSTQAVGFSPTLSMDHLPWCAAVYVLAEDAPPAWYELTLSPTLTPMSDRFGGIQLRNHSVPRVEKPVVCAGFERWEFLPPALDSPKMSLPF